MGSWRKLPTRQDRLDCPYADGTTSRASQGSWDNGCCCRHEVYYESLSGKFFERGVQFIPMRLDAHVPFIYANLPYPVPDMHLFQAELEVKGYICEVSEDSKSTGVRLYCDDSSESGTGENARMLSALHLELVFLGGYLADK